VTQLTDWITAVSTLLTAPVAVFSGLAAWYTYQGSKRSTSILTEVSLDRVTEQFLKVEIAITNLDVENIVVSSVEAVSPRATNLHEAISVATSSYLQEYAPNPYSLRQLLLSRRINSPGQEYYIGSHRFGENRTTILFYVRSSGLRAGQMIKFRLRYSTSSLNVRNKALDARAIIPAAPKSSTEEIAKNTA